MLPGDMNAMLVHNSSQSVSQSVSFVIRSQKCSCLVAVAVINLPGSPAEHLLILLPLSGSPAVHFIRPCLIFPGSPGTGRIQTDPYCTLATICQDQNLLPAATRYRPEKVDLSGDKQYWRTDNSNINSIVSAERCPIKCQPST